MACSFYDARDWARRFIGGAGGPDVVEMRWWSDPGADLQVGPPASRGPKGFRSLLAELKLRPYAGSFAAR